MVHPNGHGRRDPWRRKLDALNRRYKAIIPSPLGGRLATQERLQRFARVSRARKLCGAVFIGITASWAVALAVALACLLMGVHPRSMRTVMLKMTSIIPSPFGTYLYVAGGAAIILVWIALTSFRRKPGRPWIAPRKNYYRAAGRPWIAPRKVYYRAGERLTHLNLLPVDAEAQLRAVMAGSFESSACLTPENIRSSKPSKTAWHHTAEVTAFSPKPISVKF
jgi:hypothetical protein